MTSYFLPSYFQKRLLRYALSRLDFLETDALDLDNLGIQWGQRSVVELKNVGIQIKRLAEVLPLPEEVTLTHARIGLLRLTIPADLNWSGIVAEIEGIDVRLKFRNQVGSGPTETRGQPGRETAPSRGSKANRPRISSKAIHDPGGQAIPFSQDLAVSFLESEPIEERYELQAAIETQSHHLHESIISNSTSGDDLGLGVPGGILLPSFLANFFKGVVDRLSLEIRDVTINFEMELPQDGTDEKDVVCLTFKMAELVFNGIKPQTDVKRNEGRRTIDLHNMEILLRSEPELLLPVSATSSPRLSKSRSKMTSTGSRSSTAESETFGAIDRDLQRPTHHSQSLSSRGRGSKSRSESSSDESPPFASTDGLVLDKIDFMTRSSASLDASMESSLASQIWAEQGLPAAEASQEIDNQAHAEELARTSTLDTSVADKDLSSMAKSEDLSESRMFTHDEAESMYMSAVSGGFQEDDAPSHAMPGAWDRPSSTRQAAKTNMKMQQLASGSSPTDAIDASGKGDPSVFRGVATVQPSKKPTENFDINEAFNEQPDRTAHFVAKRIFNIDSISATLPDSVGLSEPGEDGPLDQSRTHSRSDPRSMPSPSQPMETPFSSQLFQSNATIYDPDRRPASAGPFPEQFPAEIYNAHLVQIGNISSAVDLSVGKLLVRMCQEGLRMLPKTTKGAQQTKTTLPILDLRVKAIDLNVCESVPKTTDFGALLPSPSSNMELRCPETCLLHLSFSAMRWAVMSVSGEQLQQITLGKISFQHDSKPLLYFEEDIRASSTLNTSLLPDDLVVHIKPEANTTRTVIRLRRVHAVLDLLQLDDVLSRSGGLSSILELGSSIVSTSTVKGGPFNVESSHSRPRSVRFESSAHQAPTASSTPAMPGKFAVHIVGSVVDLVGSDTTMSIKTSGVKIVYRQNLAGLRIKKATVVGPVSLDTKRKAEITVNLSDIALSFLTSPDETDLERLISLLTPSDDKYEQDDDIMVDTLLRQRRKGSVLRFSVSELQSDIDGLAWQEPLSGLLEELSKLSSVAKYLPDDDRPGLLTFVLIERCRVSLTPDGVVGPFHLKAELLEAAYVNIPSLMAAQANTLSLYRINNEGLIHEVVSHSETKAVTMPPMLMCRFIADEMEPKVRLKLSNICLEYRVSTLIALTEMIERLSATKSEDPTHSRPSSPSSSSSENSTKPTRRIGLHISTRESAIGLTPLGASSKAVVLLTDASFSNSPSRRKDNTSSLDIKKASILIIDDVAKLDSDSENADRKVYFDETDHVQHLVRLGFVPIGHISAASAVVRILREQPTGNHNLDIEFRNNLFILETCADSTQTLIQILSNLSPPSSPSKISKYRTEVVPIEDMLASFTGNAYVASPGPDAGLQASPELISVMEEDSDEELDDDETTYFPADFGEAEDEMVESYVESELSQSQMTSSLAIAPVGITESVIASSHDGILAHSLLDFRSDHFSNKSTVGGTAHRWNSTQNTYGLGTERGVKESPLKLRVRDVHIIWNLFDGYDWQSTRDRISQAVKDIEMKAASKRPRSNSRLSPRLQEEDDESVIGDFLFNSIYIGIPKNPGDLSAAINHDLGDGASVSETGSDATSTTVTTTPTRRQSFQHPRTKRLRLNRSKHHKMAFELKGVSADLLVFPPSAEEVEKVESSIDIRIKDLEIFDQVPTSTWKKFATYMHDAGEREVDTNMIHLEILNVRPVADLAASEMVLKVTILPLRLHVDQDALDFLTRFFEFKDDRVPVSNTPSAPPFLQRVEVNPVRLLLDFKPKRVDYGGLRSGRTTEFMNFFVLDRADMVLRRVILYGVSGFDRMGIMLNNIWTPDVKRNQLPGILRSLAPIRPITDVGSGLRELVVIPMREYKKDGRVVRSIQKGAVAFATTTAKELVNFGAKLAIGTQTVLQNTETLLAAGKTQNEDELDEDDKKQISRYADQPIGIIQGLRGGYASLERDLLLAKDAIIAVPGEVMESGSATGAAKAVLKSTPTIILRPAIGATKALGQTLLGAGNAMDKRNLRRMEEKYKPGR